MAKFTFNTSWYTDCVNNMSSQSLSDLIGAICLFAEGGKPTEYLPLLKNNETVTAFNLIASEMVEEEKRRDRLFTNPFIPTKEE